MKLINLFVVSVFLILGMTSCGGVKNDPVEISKAIISSMKKGKFVGIEKFALKPEDAGNSFNDWQDAYDNPEGKNEGIVKTVKRLSEAEYTLEEQSIDKDRAEVRYKVQLADSESSIRFFFEKIDGKWYLKTFY